MLQRRAKSWHCNVGAAPPTHVAYPCRPPVPSMGQSHCFSFVHSRFVSFHSFADDEEDEADVDASDPVSFTVLGGKIDTRDPHSLIQVMARFGAFAHELGELKLSARTGARLGTKACAKLAKRLDVLPTTATEAEGGGDSFAAYEVHIQQILDAVNNENVVVHVMHCVEGEAIGMDQVFFQNASSCVTSVTVRRSRYAEPASENGSGEPASENGSGEGLRSTAPCLHHSAVPCLRHSAMPCLFLAHHSRPPCSTLSRSRPCLSPTSGAPDRPLPCVVTLPARLARPSPLLGRPPPLLATTSLPTLLPSRPCFSPISSAPDRPLPHRLTLCRATCRHQLTRH